MQRGLRPPQQAPGQMLSPPTLAFPGSQPTQMMSGASPAPAGFAQAAAAPSFPGQPQGPMLNQMIISNPGMPASSPPGGYSNPVSARSGNGPWSQRTDGLSGRGVGDSGEALGGYVVPVEYANQKLWGVTSEYENLLNIQKDQHMLAMKQREAEAEHLRALVEMFEKQQFDDGNISARLKAKDEEAQMMMEAKQKELELFASLLQLRDKQIGELQQMCEAKQNQIQQLQRRLAEGGPGGTSGAEALIDDLRREAREKDERLEQCRQELAASRDRFGNLNREAHDRSQDIVMIEDEITKLRHEKGELEQLLVAKDKQLLAVKTLDPSMSDTSALQLGAQAIQMFHDSMRLKQEMMERDEQVEGARRELATISKKVEDLEQQLADKRDEISQMTDVLAMKTRRIAELENAIDLREKDKNAANRELQLQMEALQDKVHKLDDESRTKQKFIEQMKEELAIRDQRVIEAQSDTVRHEAHGAKLEKRLEDLNSQLTTTEQALEQMVRNNTYKDQLVREMTEQVNISETKLHSYQIHELMGSRQRQLEQRAKDSDIALSLQEKDRLLNKLTSELSETKSKIGVISNELSIERPGITPGWKASPGSMSPDRAGDGNGARALLPLPPMSPASIGGANGHQSPVPIISGHHSTHPVSTARSLGPEDSARAERGVSEPRGHGPRLASDFDVQSYHSMVTGTVHGETGHDSALPSSVRGLDLGSKSDPKPVFGQSYRPYPDDPIDAKVAEFVNLTKNRQYKALFCRLSGGTYLYGTHRVSFRISGDTMHLEALDEASNWIPIEDFVKSMEKTQGVHLQRARGEA